METAIDILGLGCVAIDDLLYVAAYPEADSKVEVRHRERHCGGLTATALVAAARLGARCAYAGVLGTDELSDFAVARFTAEGIDTKHLIREPEARPIHSTIIVDEKTKSRTILFNLHGVKGAHPGRPDEKLIRNAKVLFVDQFGLEGMIRAARIARSAGVPVVADLEREKGGLIAELTDLADHLIISRDYALLLTGEKDPAAAVKKLWTAGKKAVVVTCGAQGAWFMGGDGGKPALQKAFDVAAVDTTGCGDVFHGAYAAELARGKGLEERVRLAAAAAAVKATRRGGQAGIPTRAQVEDFLRSHK